MIHYIYIPFVIHCDALFTQIMINALMDCYLYVSHDVIINHFPGSPKLLSPSRVRAKKVFECGWQ